MALEFMERIGFKMSSNGMVMLLAALCAATGFAKDWWTEWTPENQKLCRLVPGRGKDGGTALGVYAQADGKGAGYWSRPFIYKPNTCYGAEFWVDRYRTGSEVIVENGYQWVIHGSDLSTGWTEMKTVFKTPVSDQMLTNAYKLCDYHPQAETFFDQPRMVELIPEWRKADGLELGDGEFVSGNLYSFVTHLKAPACAVTRPYVGISKGARSGFKFDIPSGGEILYRFNLPDRRFRDGEATICCAYRSAGRIVVEAMRDGSAEWTALASITDATPYQISFPAALFPCAELNLRLRMEGPEKGRMQIMMIGFSGHFEGAPARLVGATRFIEKETGKVFLEAKPNDYRLDVFGAQLPGSSDALAVWGASSGRKIFRDCATPAAKADALRIQTAANEAEAVQLVLNPARDLADVRVSVAGPLVAKGTGTIAADRVTILREHYLDITITTDQMGTRGWWPDALPPQDASLWPAKAGACTPFWVRVHPPKGTPKGVYRGELAVEANTTAGDVLRTMVPFEVEVFGFELPDRMSVATPFGFHIDTVYRYHKAVTDANKAVLREKYMKFLGDNHISPYPMTEAKPILHWKDNSDIDKASLVIDWSAYDREAERAISGCHFNALKIFLEGMGGGNHLSRRTPQIAGAKVGTPLYEKLMEIYLGQVQRHLEEKGWIDIAFVYWFDEPMGPDYDFVNDGMRRVKKYAPKLKRMITNRCTEDLMETIDTWCPVPMHFKVPALEKCRARGDNLWWYICCSPPGMFIGEHIDHPGTDMRAWLWQTWGEGVTGILVWALEWWTGRTAYPDPEHPQDPWIDPVGWGKSYTPGVKRSTWCNGEGRYMYPPLAARNGRQKGTVLEGPVTCYRMELLRDGIEDYEYFAMLKRLDPKNPLLAVPKAVYTDLDAYSADPSHMETHREKLARAIEQLSEKRK